MLTRVRSLRTATCLFKEPLLYQDERDAPSKEAHLALLHSKMKPLSVVSLTALLLAIAVLGTRAAPVPNVSGSTESRGNQLAAWWDSYLSSAAFRKQLGPEDIWRSSRDELAQHLDAFHQRLDQLDYLKRSVKCRLRWTCIGCSC